MLDEAGLRDSRYEVRSIGEVGCKCIRDDSTSNFGCHCEFREVLDPMPRRLHACKIQDDAVLCVLVWPNQQASSMYTNRDVSVLELADDALLQRSEY